MTKRITIAYDDRFRIIDMLEATIAKNKPLLEQEREKFIQIRLDLLNNSLSNRFLKFFGMHTIYAKEDIKIKMTLDDFCSPLREPYLNIDFYERTIERAEVLLEIMANIPFNTFDVTDEDCRLLLNGISENQ